MSIPLEDERKALLERMRESRRHYRSMFIPADEHDEPADIQAFPRSRTFKFITRHPYYTSMGLLAALSMMPRGPLNKAVKGGIAITAGVLASSARTLMVHQVLPSVVRSFRSRNRRP
ncbi:hypothetical protein [Nitrosovibrio sp. Nv6]|uniref:hypothetical protein n=1 Tax=Nitrosovibrio sp. Nv6 TaxID=1855340 RepID=UPI0008CF1C0F|nr:hypothetical protein [Nitrosovibrio sp. Nv6]SEP32352.1 hypothetical protein SAMN05216316_2430 [Nitrosovibrio sp. Nv6]